ncbi:Membrane-anchored protein [Deinococcus saxicola]|uniref:COG4705 family protein n=1 Tax=Deinococcus saxicola TaxID=249406 RepID=UPI0039EF6A13
MSAAAVTQDTALRTLISKVPEVTAFFWIIKVLATTVGETAADFLNTNLNLGLTGTSLIMGALLIAVLIVQFRLKKYVPGVYWLAIVLVSVVGTLITDNLTDNFGVSLWTSSAIFAAALAATFTAWYLRERTLSIHSIFTARREAFYWLAVLFTFALGTATGDLLAEKLQLGYLNSVLLFAGVIALTALAHVYLKLGSILTFWIIYILTRPLGASIGDFLSQAKVDGGLGLGTTVTSAIFLAAILAVVGYLAVTRRDQVTLPDAEAA